MIAAAVLARIDLVAWGTAALFVAVLVAVAVWVRHMWRTREPFPADRYGRN